MMPGPADSSERGIRLGDALVVEASWVGLRGRADPPTDITRHIVRRGRVPAGSTLRGAALLDAAAARAGRGVALENETKAAVAKVATDAGEAIELRWTTGTRRSATRLLLIPGGYCELTIVGARADADIAAFFASAQVRASGAD
jgi:hypothetical protein